MRYIIASAVVTVSAVMGTVSTTYASSQVIQATAPAYTEAQYQAQIVRCEKIADWLRAAPYWPPVNFGGWPEAILRQKIARAKAAVTQAQKDASYAELSAVKDIPW